VLHEVTDGGGVGFCHASLPQLLPLGYHGPLVVALDSNILIDLQDHGGFLVNGEPPARIARDRAYLNELEALTRILDLWMIRDIRFVVTPRARSDGKRIRSHEHSTRRLATIDRIAESLAFQTHAWGTDPSLEELSIINHIDARLPDNADRDLVSEALALDVHVFLTRDRKLTARVESRIAGMLVVPPSHLADEFIRSGVELFSGGLCLRPECPYTDGQLPAPDMGKWHGLLSALEV
jgi:hypothetical protein